MLTCWVTNVLLTFWGTGCLLSCLNESSEEWSGLIAWPQFSIAARSQCPMGTIIFSLFFMSFTSFLIVSLVLVCICVCSRYVCGNEHASAYIRRSEEIRWSWSSACTEDWPLVTRLKYLSCQLSQCSHSKEAWTTWMYSKWLTWFWTFWRFLGQK